MGVSGLLKITRICASVSALLVGEIEAIHGGSDGFGSAATGASASGAVGPHAAIASAAIAATDKAETLIPRVVDSPRRG